MNRWPGGPAIRQRPPNPFLNRLFAPGWDRAASTGLLRSLGYSLCQFIRRSSANAPHRSFSSFSFSLISQTLSRLSTCHTFVQCGGGTAWLTESREPVSCRAFCTLLQFTVTHNAKSPSCLRRCPGGHFVAVRRLRSNRDFRRLTTIRPRDDPHRARSPGPPRSRTCAHPTSSTPPPHTRPAPPTPRPTPRSPPRPPPTPPPPAPHPGEAHTRPPPRPSSTEPSPPRHKVTSGVRPIPTPTPTRSR